MKKEFPIIPICCFAFLTALFSVAAADEESKPITDADWTSLNKSWIWYGTVNAAVYSHGKAYVAGTLSGGGNGNQIAVWDGSGWGYIGMGSARGGDTIYALACDSSGNLFAGGKFDSIGGIAAKNIARWDGTKWNALGKGIYSSSDKVSYVHALCCDRTGNLYVGGFFRNAGSVSAANVAEWNGTEWKALATSSDYVVCALVLDSLGHLFAGGSFDSLDGVKIKSVAEWDGGSWRQLGSKITGGNVCALAISPSGVLYAGGRLIYSEYNNNECLVRWNGTDWETAPGGIGMDRYYAEVYALAFDSDGNLYVGGFLNSAGMIDCPYIVKYNGTDWDSLGAGLDTTVYAIACGSDGRVFVGCDAAIGGQSQRRTNFAIWDGDAWSRCGTEPRNMEINAVAVDSKGIVYAGGQFTVISGKQINYGAKWDGSSWDTLRAKLISPIDALLVDNQDVLYIGDGSNQIECMVMTPNSAVIAGGTFKGKVGIGQLDCWGVLSLAYDGEGKLYAGTDTFVARWDGDQWTKLGGWKFYNVYALVGSKNGGVIAGGFSGDVLMYDNIGWSSIGSTDGEVYALARDSVGNLYAGGSFDKIDGVEVHNIAQYGLDGYWRPLGSGTYGTVYSLVVRDSTLYVGGSLESAGKAVASGIAKVNIHTPAQTLRASCLSQKTFNSPLIRYTNSKLILSGINTGDHLAIYSLTGRCLRDVPVSPVIDLRGIARQSFIVQIRRKTAVYSKMIIRQ